MIMKVLAMSLHEHVVEVILQPLDGNAGLFKMHNCWNYNDPSIFLMIKIFLWLEYSTAMECKMMLKSRKLLSEFAS